MSWDCPGAYQYSFNADVDLSSVALNSFMAVAIGPAQNVQGSDQGNAAVVAYADGQNFIGILQGPARQGDPCTIMLRGFSRCQCATAWTVGQNLKVVTGGKLAPAASGDTVFAIAANSAVPGDIGTCYLK